MSEMRFYTNNSNSKWISIGVIPSTTILNDDAKGFFMEAYLCGEKVAPLPLGGLHGLAALFNTIRQLPNFQQYPVGIVSVEPSDNITLETCKFSEDVSDSSGKTIL